MRSFFANLREKFNSLANYSIIFLSFALLIGLIGAISHRWICDDAFISFRYAKNLFDGLGLVYNAGERVEGFTNFLWTIFISFGMLIRIDPMRFVQAVGILSYLALIVYAYFFGKKIKESLFIDDVNTYFSFTSLALALHPHSQIYATGGLETTFFSLLNFAGFYYIYKATRVRHLLLGNSFLVLSMMTRPDGFIFYLSAFIYSILFKFSKENLNNKFIRHCVGQLPFLLLFLPYWIWRWDYFGWFFPNTFYAKSINQNYFTQGIKYLFLYFNSYYILYSIPLLFIAYFYKSNNGISTIFKNGKLLKRRLNQKSYKDSYIDEVPMEIVCDKTTEIFFLLTLPVIVYTTFLAKIGGDFMFGRLLIPLSPFLFLITEVLLNKIFVVDKVKYVVSGIFLLGLVLYYNPYKGEQLPVIDNISNEHEIYKLPNIYRIKNEAIMIREYFHDNKVKIAYGGSQAMLAYFLNPLVAIETTTGLTDSFIAHREIGKRGKVGHEKKTPIKYLQKRGIHLHLYSIDLKGETNYNVFKWKAYPYPFRIICYDAKIFKALEKTNQFEFVDFEKYLDKYIESMSKFPLKKIDSDYKKFKKYYFRHNHDPIREGKIKEILGEE
jgi:hypothetical protein